MPKRRGNHEGSIRRIRRRRAEGTWYETWLGEIMLGYRDDGRPDRRAVTGATRQEVQAKLRELAEQKTKGKLVRRSTQTLADYLRAWLDHHKRYGAGGAGLRPNTLGTTRPTWRATSSRSWATSRSRRSPLNT